MLSQHLRQIAHKAKEICALDPLVEDLVAHVTMISDSCHQRGVLDFDGNLLCDWFPFFSPCIVVALLIQVKASFVYEDNIHFAPPLILVVGQKAL